MPEVELKPPEALPSKDGVTPAHKSSVICPAEIDLADENCGDHNEHEALLFNRKELEVAGTVVVVSTVGVLPDVAFAFSK